MDGSDHPKQPDASVAEPPGPDSRADTQSPSDSISVEADLRDATSRGLKRPLEEDSNTEVSEKRQQVDSEDDDDELDIDALMAHLQQHTDPGPSKPPSNELTHEDTDSNANKEIAHAADLQREAELSIAAQLRGALSSLQDLDSDGADGINLDELSQMLRPAEERPTDETTDDKQHAEASAISTEQSQQEEVEKETVTDQSSENKSVGTEAKEPSPVKPAHESKREALMSQMPPPPAHLRGNLPPMPPPPAAFTSPVASYSASELSNAKPSQSDSSAASLSAAAKRTILATTSASPGSIPTVAPSSYAPAGSSKPASELASKFPEPLFSELPAVSEKYGAALSDQVDGIYKQTQQEKAERLSKNAQGILEPNANTARTDNASGVPSVGAGAGAVDSAGISAGPGASTSASTSALNYVALHLNENKAILQARKRSILLLDSLACQVLDALSFNHYQDTLATVMQPESDRGMAYRILLDAFEDLKRVYSKWETPSSRTKATPKLEEVRPFLSYEIPGIEDSRDNLITIQRVNLATFVAAIFGSIEIGFYELNDWFIKVFVPENGRLLKQQGNIYLDLKTQAYISALESTDDREAQQAALDHLFPTNLESQMREMFGDRITLAPTEKDFVAKCHRRKENIKSEDVKDLPMKYHWVPFLRDVSEYISRNHYTLLPQRKHSIVPTELSTHPPVPAAPSIRNYPGTRRQAPAASSRGGSVSAERDLSSAVASEGAAVTAPPTSASSKGSSRASSVPPSASDVEVSAVVPASKPLSTGNSASLKVELDDIFSGNDTANKNNNTVADTASAVGPSQPGKSTSDDKVTPPSKEGDATPAAQQQQRHPSIPLEGHPLFPPLPKQVLPRPSPVTTSAESTEKDRIRRPGPRPQADVSANLAPGTTNTLAVYEAARASAEGTDLVRPKVSLYTTRRTWTKEEEEALLKGMDRVQGPYWAQILELYGPGGKINEVLKDRTQVQLKDKARNLKMFFVRLGLPIPAVFQYVTGDYETRKSSSKRVRDKKQLKAGPLQNQQAPPQQQMVMPSANPQMSMQQRAQPQIANTISMQVNQNHTGPSASSASEVQTRENVTTNYASSAATANTALQPTGQPLTTVVSEAKTASSNDVANETRREAVVEEVIAAQQSASTVEISEDDKAKEVEEDLSSLLDRVGEYVDSH